MAYKVLIEVLMQQDCVLIHTRLVGIDSPRQSREAKGLLIAYGYENEPIQLLLTIHSDSLPNVCSTSRAIVPRGTLEHMMLLRYLSLSLSFV